MSSFWTFWGHRFVTYSSEDAKRNQNQADGPRAGATEAIRGCQKGFGYEKGPAYLMGPSGPENPQDSLLETGTRQGVKVKNIGKTHKTGCACRHTGIPTDH